MQDVLQRVQGQDCMQIHPPRHHQDVCYVEGILGGQDYACQPDRHSRQSTQLWDGRRQKQQLVGRLAWGTHHQLWSGVCRYPRVCQDRGLDNRNPARTSQRNAAVLHGHPTTNPPTITRCNSSAVPTTPVDCHNVIAEAATATNNSSNNQMACELPSAQGPHSSSTTTGITAALTGAMSTTTTPVQHAPNLARCITPKPPAPTPWAD